MNEESIFAAALQKNAPDERAAFLDVACQGNSRLRADVEELLEASDRAGGFLETSPVHDFSPAADGPTLAEGAGSVIGPYKLIEQIGEGGFGAVFMAEQERPVRRKVALKVIKPGMDTRQVIGRFEAERQALAMMDHPNIAKVLDAGATKNGRPYFVMELVQGVPITDYCDQCNLSTRERLELFITVCHAVQHAHQKGVIHRDIKPGNVLVAMQDGHPTPKIIDFGVAKAIGERLTEHTLTTGFAQMLGTPLYMSPEQAELSPLGVDTRSDIYSLGVLLYELLTSTTPFDKDRLHSASYDELRRIIREEEPPKPSTRLSSLSLGSKTRRGEERAGVRVKNSLPLGGMGPNEHGQLNVARAQCGSHSRSEREGVSAAETAALATTIAERRRTDPRRLVQQVRGELDWIVMKCLEKDRNRRYETPNSLARDIERYLHDEPIEACPPSAVYRFRKFARRHKLGVAAGLAVAAALVFGVAGTTGGMLWALQERTAAQASAARAEMQASRNERVSGFLSAIAMLSNVGPSVASGHDTTLLREILDGTHQRFTQGDFKDQPAVEATLRHSIGNAYFELGDYATAESMLRQALALTRTAYGEDDLHLVFVADSLCQLGLRYMNNGELLHAQGALQEALAIFEKILNDGDPRVLGTRRVLTGVLRSEGKFAESEQLYRIGLDAARKRNDVPWIGDYLLDLGAVLVAQSKYAEAEPLLREALAVREKTWPKEWWGHYDAISTLGGAVAGQGRFAEAEPLLLEGFEGMSRDPQSWEIRRREGLERLVKLYEAWDEAEPGKGYLAKAVQLQQKLAAMDAPPAAEPTPEVPSTDQEIWEGSSQSPRSDTKSK
jgi:serine/threonine protein kinase/tetratricopeptide (TPR) repeat protein